ncbi:MAG: AEC family transporter [Clostridiales Family XIII bacterium]|jgi:predicted permease|nr:AEC family transporter [Clostridiales Family XIII bacterium]
MVAAKVIGVFIIVFIGFLACKVGWLPVKSAVYLSRIVLFIACPCVLFLAIARQEYSSSSLHTMLTLMAVSTVLYVLSYAMGFLFCRAARVPRDETAMYVNFFATPNNGFIGIPVALAVFGQPVLFMIALLNMIQAFFLYSLGTYLLRTRSGGGTAKDGAGREDCGKGIAATVVTEEVAGPTAATVGIETATNPAATIARRGAVQILKDFFLPPVVGCLVGVVFFIFRIPVPDAVAGVLESVGSMMTPLCMMFIGIQLTESSPRRLFANRRLLAASIFRLIIIPAIFFVILLPMYLAGVPIRIGPLFLCAIIINFMTPIGAALPPLAGIYGGSVRLASEGVFLSTLMSMFTIPVASVLLEMI